MFANRNAGRGLRQPLRWAHERGWQLSAGVALRAVELRLGEKDAPGEVGTAQVSGPEIGSGEISSSQVGAAEISPDQVRAPQAGTRQVGAAEILSGQGGAPVGGYLAGGAPAA